MFFFIFIYLIILIFPQIFTISIVCYTYLEGSCSSNFHGLKTKNESIYLKFTAKSTIYVEVVSVSASHMIGLV